MAKATVFSIVLAPELHDAFLAAAQACDRPPAQVMRSLMREFIQRQHDAAALASENGEEGSAANAVNGIENAGAEDSAPSEAVAATEAPDPADGIATAEAGDAPPDAAVPSDTADMPADATTASDAGEQPAVA